MELEVGGLIYNITKHKMKKRMNVRKNEKFPKLKIKIISLQC
jgi:hypothetical protein